jgi:hypothetical protein
MVESEFKNSGLTEHDKETLNKWLPGTTITTIDPYYDMPAWALGIM